MRKKFCQKTPQEKTCVLFWNTDLGINRCICKNRTYKCVLKLAGLRRLDFVNRPVKLLVQFLSQAAFQRVSQHGVQFYESVQISFTSLSQWAVRNIVWLMIHNIVRKCGSQQPVATAGLAIQFIFITATDKGVVK